MNSTPNDIIDSHFGNIIGQDLAKARLKDILLGPTVEGGFMAPTLIIAPPGIGKTVFLRSIREIIKDILGRKTLYFETGKDMGTPTTFFEDVLNPHVHDKDAVIIGDELHEAPAGVLSILRSMIEITTSRAPKCVRKGDYEVVVNPCRHGFFFATNRVDLLDPALISRLERIDLTNYSDSEMEKILFQSLDSQGVSFNDNTLRAIAECNRGSARNVIQWSNAIRRHIAIKGKRTINKADVTEIIKKLETYPMGVSKNELNTLLHLEKSGELQMKELAARNLCAPSEQNANERYLLQRGLITIDVKRRITHLGRTYLQTLRNEGYIAPLENL